MRDSPGDPDQTHRIDCDAIRAISRRTASSSSVLIPGRIFSISTVLFVGVVAEPAMRRFPGNPGRQQFRVLRDELREVILQGDFSLCSPRHQAAVVGANDILFHRPERQVHLRHANRCNSDRIVELRSASSAIWRLRRFSSLSSFTRRSSCSRRWRSSTSSALYAGSALLCSVATNSWIASRMIPGSPGPLRPLPAFPPCSPPCFSPVSVLLASSPGRSRSQSGSSPLPHIAQVLEGERLNTSAAGSSTDVEAQQPLGVIEFIAEVPNIELVQPRNVDRQTSSRAPSIARSTFFIESFTASP